MHYCQLFNLSALDVGGKRWEFEKLRSTHSTILSNFEVAKVGIVIFYDIETREKSKSAKIVLYCAYHWFVCASVSHRKNNQKKIIWNDEKNSFFAWIVVLQKVSWELLILRTFRSPFLWMWRLKNCMLLSWKRSIHFKGMLKTIEIFYLIESCSTETIWNIRGISYFKTVSFTCEEKIVKNSNLF